VVQARRRVPGRINEKVLFIEEAGRLLRPVLGTVRPKHGYMPIAIEALPRDQFNAWVLTQAGGKIDGQPEAAAPAPAAAPAAGEAAGCGRRCSRGAAAPAA
jgi:cytochrome c oxidase subunit 2